MSVAPSMPTSEGIRPQWKLFAAVLTAVVSVFVVYRIYQHKTAFTVGLDAFEPDFQIYWMNLLYAQLTFISLFGAVILTWLWVTREKENVLKISREEEISRYMKLIGLFSVFALVAWIAASVYTEADAAWHQVTVRDTDFTPTHIPLFYFGIPVLIVSGLWLLLWAHTRLPDYYGRVSLPFLIAVAGPMLIMPNLGFNEWGHTFFYAEELFAAPIHWGFVLLGWAIFAVGGLFLQILKRLDYLVLDDQVSGEQRDQTPVKNTL